jgi:hypothetical protein
VESEPGFEFLKREERYAYAKRNFLKREEELAQRAVRANDRLHDYDLSFQGVDFTLEGSTILWFPWSAAVLTYLSQDPSLSQQERDTAALIRQNLLEAKMGELIAFVEAEFMYVLAENLFCLSGSADPPRGGG